MRPGGPAELQDQSLPKPDEGQLHPAHSHHPPFAFVKALLVLLMCLQHLRMSKNLRKTSTSLTLVMMTSPPFPELVDPSMQMT